MRKQVTTLVFLILGSTALIVIISLVGFTSASNSASRDHKTLVKVDQTQRLTVYNAERAECIREDASKLDEARWHAVGKLISGPTQADRLVSGTDLLALPNIFDLITKGGVVNGEQIAACPPIVDRVPETP